MRDISPAGYNSRYAISWLYTTLQRLRMFPCPSRLMYTLWRPQCTGCVERVRISTYLQTPTTRSWQYAGLARSARSPQRERGREKSCKIHWVARQLRLNASQGCLLKWHHKDERWRSRGKDTSRKSPPPPVAPPGTRPPLRRRPSLQLPPP